MNIRRIAVAAVSAFLIGGLSYYMPLEKNTVTVQAADYTDYTSMGVKYRLYSDHVEVADGSAASGEVFIPLRINGIDVTTIAEGAFKGSGIISVSMSSIVHISNDAFSGCTKLAKAELSSKLCTIGSGAFEKCIALSEIVIPKSVESIGANAFSQDSALSSVTIMNHECAIDDRDSTISNALSSDGKKNTYSGTISGYDDSTAQKYAQKYGYKFVSLGVSPSASTTSAAATTTTVTTTKKTTTTTVTTTKKTTTTTKTTTKPATSATSKPSTTTSASATTTLPATTGPVVQGKPVFHISQTQVYESEARFGLPQRVTLAVEGADGLYCSSNIYLYFDSRLKLAGEAVQGSALSDQLTTVQSAGDTGDFIFLSTAGSADTGKDGDMWYIDFELPSDAKKDDRYEIYVGEPKYSGRAASLFTNLSDDSKGKAMTKHIFENAAKGAIEIVADSNVKLGDVDGNGIVDGIDASVILTQYATMSVGNDPVFTARQFMAADVDRDGRITSVDASMVLSYYAYISGSGTKSIEDFIKDEFR